MTAIHSATTRLWFVLGGIACLTAVLHCTNLISIAQRFGCSVPQLACHGSTIPWVTPDTGSYRKVAADIGRRGFLHASYLHRTFGFPLMLGCAHLLFGEAATALWFIPLLAAAACIAVGWLALALTGRASAAIIASLLFLAWPNTYQFTPLLITDASHAYLAATALAATVAWIQSERPRIGCLAGVLWAATQSIRPTFFLLPVLLPVLLWRRGRPATVARVSLAIWLASTVVPVFIVTSNYAQHGVAIVSYVEPETLACYAVPRLQEELGLASARALRSAASARYHTIANIRERVALERREAWDVLAAYPWQALSSFRGEFVAQLLDPVSPSPYARRDETSPWSWLPQVTIDLFWLCAALGLAVIMPRQPRVALFLLATFVAVMLPATTSHWVGGRLRLPLDLLFMPVVAVFLDWLSKSASDHYRDRSAQGDDPRRRLRG